MYRLIESIRLENGTFCRLSYHQQRMDNSVLMLTGKQNTIQLTAELHEQPYPITGLYKCRIVYTASGIVHKEFIPYTPLPPAALYVVQDNTINYNHKFEDRRALEKYALPNNGTDVLIVNNGLVTDTAYCNVVFFDGSRWLTPARPLLKGTMRQALLEAGQIHEEEIRGRHIRHFKAVKRINALLQFDEKPFSTSQIIW